MWLLIRWFHQKPADLDLQCFLKRISVGSAGQSVRLEIKVSLVQDSPEALHCVLEQDTLSSA